jgi:hypothetical protein
MVDCMKPTTWTTISCTYDPAGRRTSGPSLVARVSSLECRCAGRRGCVHDMRERNSVRPSASNRQSSIILHRFPRRLIADCRASLAMTWYDDNNRLLRKYGHRPDKPARFAARNTKSDLSDESETNSKHESPMTETWPALDRAVWDFGLPSFAFVSHFDIRISDLSLHYSHYDGLGSCIALSDAAGEAAVLYEHSIYGQAAASDPNHPNPFLFRRPRVRQARLSP